MESIPLADDNGSRRSINRTLLIAERDGWICNGCGEVCVPWELNQPRDTRYATVDHKDPNGGNGQDNLWLMCGPCNGSKGQTPLEEWEKTLAFDGSFFGRGFTQIPNSLLFDTTVSVGSRMTLICLMQFAWRGDPFPGQAKLAAMMGVSDRTVRDYLTELKDEGFIKVYRRGRGMTNVYRIVQTRLLSTKEVRKEDFAVQEGGDRNPASALDRNPASDKEYEVKEDEENLWVATPPQGLPRAEVWEALVEVFGEPTTKTAKSLRGKIAFSLRIALGAHGNAQEIVHRAKKWPLHFGDATLTETALEKHWDALGRPPLRSQR